MGLVVERNGLLFTFLTNQVSRFTSDFLGELSDFLPVRHEVSG